MSTTDVATGVTTYHVAAMDAAQIWRSAVALAATKARQSLPASNTRIDKAIEIILNNAVDLQDGVAYVRSLRGDKETLYEVRGGICDCPDYAQAPMAWCKHRLARAIFLKAMDEAKHFTTAPGPLLSRAAAEVGDLETEEPVPAPAGPPVAPAGPPVAPAEPVPAKVVPITMGRIMPPAPPTLEAEPVDEEPEPGPEIPRAFLVSIQGRWFVLFAGLLHMAHQCGLLGLAESVTHVTDAYVMATATATFKDGRVFTGLGDSTPDNVGAKVKPHWRRLAGTRAMARALRNALNIQHVCFEELG